MSSISSVQDRSKRLALLRKIDWRVRHAADSVLTGEYRSSFRGKGMEFDQVVPYEYGDDVRDIDWNVTARLGQPFRKKFIEEREVTIVVVFQDSVSLQFSSTGQSKRQSLIELAAMLMMMGAMNRDRVGYGYAGPNGTHLQRPLRGRGKIMTAVSHLLATPEPTWEQNAPAQPPWQEILHAVPRHSILLWLGDFPENVPIPSTWPLLARRYQMMGCRIEDPWERTLPELGELCGYDPTTGEMAVVHPGDRKQRQAHAGWVERRDAHFRSLFPDPRSRMTLSTSDDPLESLAAFLARRSFRRNRS
ncbi:MAG: DUF58 domain-containing protein [Candidatus Methylacidiphilales bacterium]